MTSDQTLSISIFIAVFILKEYYKGKKDIFLKEPPYNTYTCNKATHIIMKQI